MCLRIQFQDAESFQLHLQDVSEVVKTLQFSADASSTFHVIAPPSEIQKLRVLPTLSSATFWELDSRAFWM